jgi:hypothetical protein
LFVIPVVLLWLPHIFGKKLEAFFPKAFQ